MPLITRAIFYDAGFTLIEPVKSTAEMCAEALLRRGHPAEAAEFLQALPPFDPFLEARQQEGDPIFASDPRLTDLWHEYYREGFRQVVGSRQLPLSEEELHQCAVEVTELYGHADLWRPYPEVLAALREGKRRGFVQGVISDWGTQLPGILHDLGLTNYLDFLVVSAVIGAAKPNSHLFDLALSRARVDRQDVVYVGDNYRSDIIGGRGAGICSVLLDRRGTARPVDCPVVKSLDELVTKIGTPLLDCRM
jgi:putative hydrolase of the HAD superfamily